MKKALTSRFKDGIAMRQPSICNMNWWNFDTSDVTNNCSEKVPEC